MATIADHLHAQIAKLNTVDWTEQIDKFTFKGSIEIDGLREDVTAYFTPRFNTGTFEQALGLKFRVEIGGHSAYRHDCVNNEECDIFRRFVITLRSNIFKNEMETADENRSLAVDAWDAI